MLAHRVFQGFQRSSRGNIFSSANTLAWLCRQFALAGMPKPKQSKQPHEPQPDKDHPEPSTDDALTTGLQGDGLPSLKCMVCGSFAPGFAALLLSKATHLFFASRAIHFTLSLLPPCTPSHSPSCASSHTIFSLVCTSSHPVFPPPCTPFHSISVCRLSFSPPLHPTATLFVMKSYGRW